MFPDQYSIVSSTVTGLCPLISTQLCNFTSSYQYSKTCLAEFQPYSFTIFRTCITYCKRNCYLFVPPLVTLFLHYIQVINVFIYQEKPYTLLLKHKNCSKTCTGLVGRVFITDNLSNNDMFFKKSTKYE